MAQTVVLKVGMSCQGCAGAVTRVLTKLEGVESFDVDIKAQKVTVNTNLEPQVVLEKVSKTGKKTEFWKDEAAAKTEAITAVVKNTESVTVVAETVETAPLTTVAAEAPPATAEPTPTPAAA